MSVLADSLWTDDFDILKSGSMRAQFIVIAIDMVRSKFHKPEF